MRVLFGNKFVEIRRTADTVPAPIENVSIDHRRPNVTVAKQFLHGTDVGDALQFGIRKAEFGRIIKASPVPSPQILTSPLNLVPIKHPAGIRL